MRLIIVSGLSGAGKTVALRQLEDLGYFCVDNLPLALVGPLTSTSLKVIEKGYDRLALGIDARESAGRIADFPRYLKRLRGRAVDVHVLFLTASDDSIIRRYSETRRRHPLTSNDLSLTDAIAIERELLAPIANIADEVIDTSKLNVHELREEIAHRMPEKASGQLALSFMSFGFKNGVPDVADFVFDVRCLANPHWEPGLRALSGRDQPVVNFLGANADVQKMIGDISTFIEQWLPQIEKQDRAYLTVAIGCTGGRHRSVYVADRLREHFADQLDSIAVKHRDMLR